MGRRETYMVNTIPLRSLTASLTLEMKMNVVYSVIPNTVGGSQFVMITFNGAEREIVKHGLKTTETFEKAVLTIRYNTNQIAMYEEVIEKLNKCHPEFII